MAKNRICAVRPRFDKQIITKGSLPLFLVVLIDAFLKSAFLFCTDAQNLIDNLVSNMILKQFGKISQFCSDKVSEIVLAVFDFLIKSNCCSFYSMRK